MHLLILHPLYKDAPYFLTFNIHGPQSYYGPGDFDPEVNRRLQAALLKKYNSYFTTKAAKAKINQAIQLLSRTFPRMSITGLKAWWDSTAPDPAYPPNAGTLQNQRLGSPTPGNCLKAALNFVREGPTPQITTRYPLTFRAGKSSLLLPSRLL